MLEIRCRKCSRLLGLFLVLWVLLSFLGAGGTDARPVFPHSSTFGAEQLTLDASQSEAETVGRVQVAAQLHSLCETMLIAGRPDGAVFEDRQGSSLTRVSTLRVI